MSDHLPEQSTARGQWQDDTLRLLRIAIAVQISAAVDQELETGPADLTEVLAVFLANQTHEMGECHPIQTAQGFLHNIQARASQLLAS